MIMAFGNWAFDVRIVEFFNQLTNIKFFEYLFKGITYLGTEYVFIILIGATYWSFDKKLAKEVGIASFYAMLFNNLFKSFFNRLRPFQQSPSTITCRDTSILMTDANGNYLYNSSHTYLLASSSSFPSGHVSGASAVYNSYAKSLKKNWIWIVANVLCVLVMISRMALGVHFLTDVLTAYIVGIGMIELVYYLRSKFKNEIYLHIIMLGIFGVVVALSPLWSTQTRDLFIMYGTSVGMIIGMMFEEKKVNFLMVHCWWKKILRILFGLVIVIVLKITLKYIYSGWTVEGTYLANIFDMLRYFVMVFMAVGIYPLIIKIIPFLNDKEEKKEAVI